MASESEMPSFQHLTGQPVGEARWLRCCEAIQFGQTLADGKFHWRTIYKMENGAQNAKIYRVKFWRRASAILLVLVGFLFLIGFCWGSVAGQADPKPLGIVFSVTFTLAGIFWAISSFKSTVILSDDAIEVRGILGCKRLPLNGIRGRREYPLLCGAPAQKRQPPLRKRIDFEEDNRFRLGVHVFTNRDLYWPLQSPLIYSLATTYRQLSASNVDIWASHFLTALWSALGPHQPASQLACPLNN
jgi:hypothetical protein